VQCNISGAEKDFRLNFVKNRFIFNTSNLKFPWTCSMFIPDWSASSRFCLPLACVGLNLYQKCYWVLHFDSWNNEKAWRIAILNWRFWTLCDCSPVDFFSEISPSRCVPVISAIYFLNCKPKDFPFVCHLISVNAKGQRSFRKLFHPVTQMYSSRINHVKISLN
jgi:hypothetical protein